MVATLHEPPHLSSPGRSGPDLGSAPGDGMPLLVSIGSRRGEASANLGQSGPSWRADDPPELIPTPSQGGSEARGRRGPEVLRTRTTASEGSASVVVTGSRWRFGLVVVCPRHPCSGEVGSTRDEHTNPTRQRGECFGDGDQASLTGSSGWWWLCHRCCSGGVGGRDEAARRAARGCSVVVTGPSLALRVGMVCPRHPCSGEVGRPATNTPTQSRSEGSASVVVTGPSLALRVGSGLPSTIPVMAGSEARDEQRSSTFRLAGLEIGSRPNP